MQRTIDETNRRREKQISHNKENNIIPTTVFKTKEQIIEQSAVLHIKGEQKPYVEMEESIDIAADPVVQYMSKPQLEKLIESTRKKMQKAAKDMDFLEAARLRDEMFSLKDLLKKKFS